MARGTVVLFRGESNFGNIGSMVTALADGFGRLSFDPVIVDMLEHKIPEEEAEMTAKPETERWFCRKVWDEVCAIALENC